MDVLITDANIWIDLEVGDLTTDFIDLPHSVAVPDALFHDELVDQHHDLLELGLELRTVSGPNVARAVGWQDDYPDASRNDLLALSLAEQLDGILVTGDQALRRAARSEDVEVHGTIWIGDRLLDYDVVDESQLREAYRQMYAGYRRLPWSVINERLREWGVPELG
jgi:hypothetical protein